MKTYRYGVGTLGGILLTVVVLHLLSPEALAAEARDGWRPVYDLVMRWVNFGILVFLLAKYARTPIRDFLKGRKAELADEIQKIEAEKRGTLDALAQTLQSLEERSTRLQQVEERIIAEGEKEKQRIIEDARLQSDILMQGVQQKVSHQLQLARDRFRAEIVDGAIALAMEKLPATITDQDNRHQVERWLARVESFSG